MLVSPSAVSWADVRAAAVKATPLPPPVPPSLDRTTRADGACAVTVVDALTAGQVPPVSTQLASQLAEVAVPSDSGVLPLAAV